MSFGRYEPPKGGCACIVTDVGTDHLIWGWTQPHQNVSGRHMILRSLFASQPHLVLAAGNFCRHPPRTAIPWRITYFVASRFGQLDERPLLRTLALRQQKNGRKKCQHNSARTANHLHVLHPPVMFRTNIPYHILAYEQTLTELASHTLKNNQGNDFKIF